MNFLTTQIAAWKNSKKPPIFPVMLLSLSLEKMNFDIGFFCPTLELDTALIKYLRFETCLCSSERSYVVCKVGIVINTLVKNSSDDVGRIPMISV